MIDKETHQRIRQICREGIAWLTPYERIPITEDRKLHDALCETQGALANLVSLLNLAEQDENGNIK